jgi:carbamoyl-phosphate synthase large subunit
MNVLVTSASKKVPMIKAVKNAILRLDPQSKVFAGDITTNVISSYFCDSFWKMPTIEQISYRDIVDYCKSNNISFIIPSRDGELSFWAGLNSSLKKEDINVMVSPSDTIDYCNDKLKFFHKLKLDGLNPIFTSNQLRDFNKNSIVVKERYGAGSLSIGVNLQPSEGLDYSKKLQNPIFQPFVEGREVSADIYRSSNGKMKGVILRNRLKIENGESQITSTFRDSALEKLCERIVEVLGIFGHAVLQFIIDDQNTPHILECNCRFGGASTLSIECGLDSFYWFFLEANGSDLDNFSFDRTSREKIQVRYPADLTLDFNHCV